MTSVWMKSIVSSWSVPTEPPRFIVHARFCPRMESFTTLAFQDWLGVSRVKGLHTLRQKCKEYHLYYEDEESDRHTRVKEHSTHLFLLNRRLTSLWSHEGAFLPGRDRDDLALRPLSVADHRHLEVIVDDFSSNTLTDLSDVKLTRQWLSEYRTNQLQDSVA